MKIIKGDCLIEMSNIPDKSISLVLVDLPYGQLNKANKNAYWDKPLSMSQLWSHWRRIIKDRGAIILFGQGMFTAELMKSNPEWWRYNLIWDKRLKTGFLNAKKMPLRQHEDICVFYAKCPTYNPQMTKGAPLHGRGKLYKTKELSNNCYGGLSVVEDKRVGSTDKYPTSILHFDKPHPSKSVHPTEKPIALLEYLIETYTNEGDTVLDCCMGSGSAGVAAANCNRDFIGIELHPAYFEIAKSRILNKQNNKHFSDYDRANTKSYQAHSSR